MTYLAEVTKERQFNAKGKALLLGEKRPDGLWISCTEKEITLPSNRDLHLGQLVLLEIDTFGIVSHVSGARETIKNALRAWNLRTARFDSAFAEIALTKESLEYQAVKLYEREMEMNRRDEAQKIQEKKLNTLIQLGEEKIDAANRQHTALADAWKHLYYKETQLKGNE